VLKDHRCPRKMGQKKETFPCLTYMLSGIAFGVVRSPTVPSLEHGFVFAGHSRNGGCDAAVEGVAGAGVLGDLSSLRHPGDTATAAVCITSVMREQPQFGSPGQSAALSIEQTRWSDAYCQSAESDSLSVPVSIFGSFSTAYILTS